MALWPSGWRSNQPEYEQMILGVYATLGVFLLIASRTLLTESLSVSIAVLCNEPDGQIRERSGHVEELNRILYLCCSSVLSRCWSKRKHFQVGPEFQGDKKRQ